MSKSILSILLALTSTACAIAQVPPSTCSPAIGTYADQDVALTRVGVSKPYSLTATISTELTLFNGNKISGFLTANQARDSKGRTRVERPTTCLMDKGYQPKWRGIVTISDPVSKTKTSWQPTANQVSKVATVNHLPFVTQSTVPTAEMEYNGEKVLSESRAKLDVDAKRHVDQRSVEDLGKRNIAGLEAVGFRITRTIPAEAQGNSLPLVYVEEKWINDQYGVILLDIKEDPILGKSTYEVKTFNPGEPDPSFFRAPSDYTVDDKVTK